MSDSLRGDGNNSTAHFSRYAFIIAALCLFTFGAHAKLIELHPFFCPIVSDAPEIDGKIGGDEWAGACAIDTLIGRKNKTFNDTTVHVMADLTHLYVAFACAGPDGVPEKWEGRGRDELSRQDDGVGVIIDFEHDHEASKLFLVGYSGAQHDANKEDAKSGGWGDAKWNAEWRSAVHRGEKSWSAELAIPLGKIGGFWARPGTTVGINFFRERPQLLDSQHYVVDGGGKRSPDFADMIFGPPSTAITEIDFPQWTQGGPNTIQVTLHNFGERKEDFLIDSAGSTYLGGSEHWPQINPGQSEIFPVYGDVWSDQEGLFSIKLHNKGSGRDVHNTSYPFVPADITRWNDERLTFETSGPICFPGQPFTVEFTNPDGEISSKPPLIVPSIAEFHKNRKTGRPLLICSLLRYPGWEVSTVSPALHATRLSNESFRVELDTAGLEPGRFQLRIETTPPDDHVSILRSGHTFLLLDESWNEFGAHLADLASHMQLYDKKTEAGVISKSSSLLFRHLVETAREQIKKTSIDNYEKPLGKAKEAVDRASQLADAFNAGKDPMAGKTGLQQRAFISPNDGKAYPYYIYVPESYDGSKPYRMITDLLAQLPEPDWDKAFEDQPVFYWKTVLPQLAERDFIMVWPPGVRKIEGEKNYFAVLEQMKADYNIDPDGLYLIGVSGGGLSSWCIGLRYPHLIAAIAPISGVVQASGKVEMGPGGGDGTDNIDPARSALYFPMNALHVPAIILHGDSDPVTPHTTQALPMVEKMKELGLDYEYHEYPGADHGLGEAGYPDAFRRALVFFEKHPNIAHPKTIDYSTWNLRYNRAYWLRIDAFETEGERAWIQAKAEGNSVEIKTENVKAWTLLPDTEVFDLSQPIEIQLNGADPVSERPAQDGGIAFGSSAETPRTAAPSTPKPSRQTR